MAGGLERFKSILAEYGELAAWTVGIGAAPFVATFASLAPPWPIDIAPLTAVAQFAVLVLIYQLLNTSTERVINRVVVSSFCGVFAVGLIYIVILLNFTYQPKILPDDKPGVLHARKLPKRSMQINVLFLDGMGSTKLSTIRPGYGPKVR